MPGKSHGRRNLVGCSPWGRYELDTTERLHFHFSLSCTGGGNGNPLQCSCLENPRDGGAWWAAVYGIAQSRTRLKQLSSSSSRRDITGKVMQSSIQEKCFGTEKGREHITWGTRKGLTKEMRSETGLDNELESVCGRGTRGRELLLVEA